MIEDNLIEKILTVSALSLSQEKKACLKSDLDKIFSELDKINLTIGYDPSDFFTSVSAFDLPKDEPEPGLSMADVKAFSNSFLDGYIAVPQEEEEQK